jgi:hypothetical protein
MITASAEERTSDDRTINRICGPYGTRILADEKIWHEAHTEGAAQRN